MSNLKRSIDALDRRHSPPNAWLGVLDRLSMEQLERLESIVKTIEDGALEVEGMDPADRQFLETICEGNLPCEV